MKNPLVNGVIVLQSAVSNGAIDSKSSIEEQDLEERISPCFKQHSMRKSRVSGELERDVALSAIQSSAKLPTATPLNPVTPLRWKSTKRIESEKKKLQEEIKTKEVVKEEKNMNLVKEEKKMNLVKEEKKDQSKMEAMSSNGIETAHKVDTSTSNHFTFQEDKMLTSFVSTSKSTGMVSINAKVEEHKHSHLVTDGGSNEHAKHCDEVSFFNAKHGADQTIDDNSGKERKTLIGDESTAITIDFLRARLLAERTSSKAAKERIQQLTEKVQELEDRLNQEIQFIRKAKEVEREACMKVESLNECKVLSLTENEALFQHEKMKTDLQGYKLDQENEKCQVLAKVEDSRSNATVDTKPGLIQLASLEIKELVASDVEAIQTSEQEIGGHQCVQSSNKNKSLDVKYDGIPIVPSIASANTDAYSSTSSELKRQEIRFSTEERLHYMWNQMVVEMSTLVEDKIVEDRVREGLLNWMHQFPSVVQNILPKASGVFETTYLEENKLVLEIKTKNIQQSGGDVLPKNSNFDQTLNLKEEIVEECSMDGASDGDGSRTHDKSLKKVASLIERFEAKENIQQEWDQSNTKQHLTSRQRSEEGSLSRTNSNSGTPLSIKTQQVHQHEVTANEPLKSLMQVEDSSCYSLATDSSILQNEDMITESLFITKNSGRMGTYTSGDSTPSTYPNSPIVGNKFRRSSGDRIIPTINHGTLTPSLEHAEFGLRQSMDASFITPSLLSPSSRPRIGEKRGDIISIISEDRSQPLKQSNHSRTFDRNCLTPESHSERSSGEIGESTRSQALTGWVNLEEAQISPVLPNTRDHSSLQWDASIKGRHLQNERLAPYAQAGNSNAYIRPNHYPIRNDEREIYRGRMESVSRSMEGLGSSWRSLSDAEGDETQLFADIPDAITSSISKRSSSRMSFQDNGGLEWSNYYQHENMEETSQSFTHPGRDFPKENFRSRSTSSKIESTSSKVNEVLKALQLAKLSIKKFGTKRSTISSPYHPTSERSNDEGDRHNLRTDYGFFDGQSTNETPASLRIWSQPEISRRYSIGTFQSKGSTTSHLHATNSMPFGMFLDSHQKYPDEKYLIG